MANVVFPHVTKSTASTNKYEPVVPSNFNAYIILIGDLKDKLGSDYTELSEYIKSVGGMFIEKSGNTIDAGYKTTKFRYDSNEKETTYDVVIGFQNFLDNTNKQFIYNKLVAWSRVKYNPLTGTKSLKAMYANAVIVVEKFNRDGSLYWRRVASNVFPMNDFDDQVADYATHDMAELEVTFNADYVSDITSDELLTRV
jgi:hypothetical protein